MVNPSKPLGKSQRPFRRVVRMRGRSLRPLRLGRDRRGPVGRLYGTSCRQRVRPTAGSTRDAPTRCAEALRRMWCPAWSPQVRGCSTTLSTPA